jgi:hypothetical protein
VLTAIIRAHTPDRDQARAELGSGMRVARTGIMHACACPAGMRDFQGGLARMIREQPIANESLGLPGSID